MNKNEDKCVFRWDEFSLDVGARSLKRGSSPIRLTPKEFQALLLLVRRAGEAISREALIKELWPDTFVGDTSLSRSISVLRKNLGNRSIETVSKFGYRFSRAVNVDSAIPDALAVPSSTYSMATHICDTMVGRDGELGRLRNLVEETTAGKGSVVMIGGEPGIGKTRLGTELLRHVESRGFLGITGHCYEMEGSQPHLPFVEILEDICRKIPHALLRDLLGSDASELTRFVPDLCTFFPEIPMPLEIPLERQRRFIFNAYRSFLRRLTEARPAVMIVEDLQWADEPTLMLLMHLVHSVEEMPLLIVCTFRDVTLDLKRPFAGVLESLVRNRSTCRMALRRLPANDVQRVLERLAGRPVPSRWAQFFFSESDGNPFFVEEVFHYLKEEGRLFDEAGSFRPPLAKEEIKVPQTVRLISKRRIEKLGENTRSILGLAALIGRVFSTELLTQIEDSDPDAVMSALEQGEVAYMIEVHGAVTHVEYQFVHELVRQTLVESISRPRRQQLHARILKAMQGWQHGSPGRFASALAYHCWESGNLTDENSKVRLLTEAAERAILSAAYEDAHEHLVRALSLLAVDRSLRVAELHRRLAQVLHSMHEYEKAISEFELALDMFDELQAHDQFVQTSIELQLIHAWAVQQEKMIAILRRAIRHGSSGDASLKAIVMAVQAASAGQVGSIDVARATLEKLLELPKGELSPKAFDYILKAESIIRLHTGQLDLCENATKRALQRFTQAGDIWSQVEFEHGLFVRPLLCGCPQEAEKRILEAIPRAEQIGHEGARVLALRRLAEAQLAKGELEVAECTARESLKCALESQTGFPFLVEAILGKILICRGKFDEAVPLLRNSTRSPRNAFDGIAEGALAVGLAIRDDPDALNACNQASEFLPRPGCTRGIGAWYAAISLVEAFALLGDRERAAGLLPELERILCEWDYSSLGFPVKTAAGIAAASNGDWLRAEEYHRSAISRMDDVPYPVAGPIARYWYADMLCRRDNSGGTAFAKELLIEAEASSKLLGLSAYEGLISRRLEALC